MSAVELFLDNAEDAIQEQTRKFKTLEAAHQYWKGKSRLEFTVCMSTDKNFPWEVRPKNDLEMEQDAYWREFR